jgi:catalase (peroxidase I)
MNISIIARRPFFDLFYKSPSMPSFLRLALIDSLSFDSNKSIGGPINNFLNHKFLKQRINQGLKPFLKEINEIHNEGNHITSMLSVSDLIQIGGAAAIEYSGGPKISVKTGRPEVSYNLSENSAFPDVDFDIHDIKSRYSSLGLSSTEVVALFGYRTLGFLSNKLENKEYRWTGNPFVFDNTYYSELMNPNSEYLKTTSDKALLNDSEYLEIISKFANDQRLFFDEFSKVYSKIGEFGIEKLYEEKVQHM